MATSPLLPLSSLAWQKRVASDQVQGVGYSEPEVETFVAALELETSLTTLELEMEATAIELEMNVATLELETNAAALELEMETNVSQEISKQE
jgi:voltage-gated potassium channel Kch